MASGSERETCHAEFGIELVLLGSEELVYLLNLAHDGRGEPILLLLGRACDERFEFVFEILPVPQMPLFTAMPQ
jgi:hypothetical protein